MKSITTIEKEFLLQRLELSHDLTHAISCSLEERIAPLEKEIERLARYLEDLRSDISMFLCIYEPDDPLFQDMSDKLKLDSVDPIYEEVPGED